MGKSVKEVMSSNPCAIDADKPVSHAAKMMKDEGVGLAPVVEGNRLVGTLTDRDIVTVTPQQDLDEALQLMAKNQVRRLPVIEEDGRLVGVVAQADVARQADDKKTASSSRRSRRNDPRRGTCRA